MRLLHTGDLHFEEFFDSNIPRYAILSHRWGEKEVTFQQMSKSKAPEGAGLQKIKDCCRTAWDRNYQWVWIDTCCIDKKSSAELSEAINSMFRWYKNAWMCFVYLSDVLSERPRARSGTKKKLAFEEEFTRSAWFTRGWTLQELLAPSRITFYNRNWTLIGTKNDLLDEIFKATDIQRTHLWVFDIQEPCVAEKMSWLSRRTTSRIEDMSYCMLGLFGINLLLLYGEGENAFNRLQLEIIRKSTDESIFVFDPDPGLIPPWSVLARFPAQFCNSGDVRLSTHTQLRMERSGVEPGTGALGDRPPYSLTNKGLKFRIPPRISNAMLHQRVIQIPLGCCRLLDAHTVEGCRLTLRRPHGQDTWGKFDVLPEKLWEDPVADEKSGSENVKWTAIYLWIRQ